jgi:inosose dehydratase
VPILWNNVDLTDLSELVPAETVLDEIARTGYEGTQEGRGFPRGEPLRAMLADRGLRLAEVYASIPCATDGPTPGALDAALDRLAILHEGGGDVLVAALDGTADRAAWAGRAADPATPRLTPNGWTSLATLVDTLARRADDLGHPLAWHPHTGTYVETPAEADRLFELTDPDLVRICLDVGHWTVGGGNPVEAIRRLGERVTHVHLKDVDPDVLAGLRSGTVRGWDEAIRVRLFTELGAGVLDLPGILAALAERDFAGWLMVEQDSCWGPPSESAAIGRRVLAAELRRLGSGG